MNIKVLGNLDADKIVNTVKKAQKLVPIPKNTSFYFLENIDLCYSIKLPRPILERFKASCRHKISFSLRFRNKNIIVIYMEKQIIDNSSALIGLLIHELTHIKQMILGTYKNIYTCYNKNYKKSFDLLMSLKYNKKSLELLFKELTPIIILTLKDIYANNFLIKKNLTNYLISYYKIEFNRKLCPKPIFYKNLKQTAKNDLMLIRSVFEFELSLLSVILPLYKTNKANNLVNIIESCYEINISDISEKCHDLIRLYFAEFGKSSFNCDFIDLVFYKVHQILD